MTNSEAGMSRDVAQALGGEYEVFLSFRGSDTRHGFTDFLYHGLINVGVRVFRDEDELQEGEVIGHNLLRAINNSILYIPIFSQDYASSKWCLRELALMVNNVSKAEGKKSILPIFFDVEPEDVKLKTPRYSTAFLEHDKKFPTEAKDWRKALEEVDEIKGWNVKKDQSQAKIVEVVVQKVLEKLVTEQKLVPEDLIGLDDRVKHLTEFLNFNHRDWRLIAIYGMGGIGKSTIAKVIFNRLSYHFVKCCSFLDDVRENSLTEEGIVQLQKKLLSGIGDSKSIEQVRDSERGMRIIGRTLCSKKVLVVLDDVAEEWHIKNLIGNYSFHSGSRIIITTRDKTIPLVEGFNDKILRYEMLKMDDDLALQLFRQHAFGKDFPSDDYRELSSEIVSYMGGLPLAIEVIGSSLKRRDKPSWEETLDKIKNVPEEKILKKLKISYDGLNKNHKEIFLDIACFFSNKKTDAIYMWASCRFQPRIGIEVLIEKCLIKIFDNDQFWMHDQLIDLGRQIVREESEGDLEKQSRLWIAEEALQIIGTKERKHKVQALNISTCSAPIEIRNENFERLPNLRFLNLERGTYVGDFARCHSKLRWFSWSNPPFWEDHKMTNFDLDFRADNLYMDELAICKLRDIGFKDDSKAWDLIKRAQDLKVLSISWCLGITTIPNISMCTALERLTLDGCSNLKKIESFIGDLRSLIMLEIKRCSNFTNLPEEVGLLVKLKHFSLLDCKELRELPSSLGNLTSLTKLNLSGTKIKKLPNSIGHLQALQILHFHISWLSDWDNHDWQLPSGISALVNLEELDLSRHNKVKGEIPIEIGEWSSLRILMLRDSQICRIPRTINKLHHLQILDLTDCHGIQELPELPTSLTYLHFRSISLLLVPNLSKLTNLVNLLLSDGSYYRDKSNLISGCDLRWIGNLSRLKWLELDLLNIPAPLELASLSHLEKLVLGHLDLKSLVQLPSFDWSWRNLSTLDINCCEVEDISVDGLSQLKNLMVNRCEQLQRLSVLSGLRKLSEVSIDHCPKLVEIQVVGVLKLLKWLTIYECKSLIRISGLVYLKNLKRLEIGRCEVVTSVEGLNELESLEILLVYNCSSLRRLIDASCTKISDDCFINIYGCGYFIKDGCRLLLKHYREEVLRDTSNEDSFTVRFHLGVKMPGEGWFGSVGGIEREKEGVNANSLTYEGLIADVKNFGFRFKRMWHVIPRSMQREIKSDRDVNQMLRDASARGGFFIHLFVEGGIDSRREGEYDEEIMEILREEWRMKSDGHSDEDEAKWCGFLALDLDSDSASMGGESRTHGTSSLGDFELELGNAECFEATTSIAEKDLDSVKKQVDLHEEPKDEETITSKRCGEDISLNTLNKEKRDKTIETDRVPAKTGRGSATRCASNSGRGPATRGRGRDTTSTSRNGKGLRLGRDVASTLWKGSGSNSGRDKASGSRSSTTSSLGRAKGSTPGKGTNLSSGRGVTLSLSRGSSSGMDTAKMGIASSSKRGITPSSLSSATLSTGRGRGSTSRKGTTVSSGRGTNLSLGRGMTRMGTSLRPGTNEGSSSAKVEPRTSRSQEEQ